MSNDLMFDIQIKDILKNSNSIASIENLYNSQVALSIVLAAKKSMHKKRTINLR